MNIDDMVQALLKIVDESSPKGQTNVFAEFHLVQDDESTREAVLGANRDGLIYLAIQCLKLAETGVPGSHYHFDEAGVADKADPQLVIVRRKAEWD